MSTTLTFQGRVALVTMDDGKANALRLDSMAQLRGALREAEASDAGAVVLAGRTGFFSAGLDLRVFPRLDHAAQVETYDALGDTLLTLYLLGKPVVAAVTGHAMAGGALLALACDARVGSEGSAKFAVNEVAIGLPMPAFGVEIVRTGVPRGQEVPILLHGRTFTQAEARDRGVFESIQDDARVVEVALHQAGILARIPTRAYAETKRVMRAHRAARARAAMPGEVEPFLAAFHARSPSVPG